jgi:hypothetical protein
VPNDAETLGFSTETSAAEAESEAPLEASMAEAEAGEADEPEIEATVETPAEAPAIVEERREVAVPFEEDELPERHRKRNRCWS